MIGQGVKNGFADICLSAGSNATAGTNTAPRNTAIFIPSKLQIHHTGACLASGPYTLYGQTVNFLQHRHYRFLAAFYRQLQARGAF